jgi:hypothetical protein
MIMAQAASCTDSAGKQAVGYVQKRKIVDETAKFDEAHIRGTPEKEKKEKKKKQINHTSKGIGRGCQPARQVEADNRKGRGGGKARNTGVQERNLSITITRSQSIRV